MLKVKAMTIFVWISAIVIFIILATSFTSINISERAIILGLAIDLKEDHFIVTAEVVKPSGATSGEGATSKLTYGEGETVPLAIQEMYQKTGRSPSLGQCCILLLGENLVKSPNTDIIDILAYFNFSENFKDGTVVACSKGDAQELFKIQTPLDSYISLMLQHLLNDASNGTTTPKMILQTIINESCTHSKSGFLPFAEFIKEDEPSTKTDERSKKISGFFRCDKFIVFDSGKYKGDFSKDATRGYLMLKVDKSFDAFVVTDHSDDFIYTKKISVGILSKQTQIDYNFEDNKPVCKIRIDIRAKKIKTDTIGEVLDAVPKIKDDDEYIIKKSVEKQVSELVQATIETSKNLKCDILNFSNAFFKQYGQQWENFVADNENNFLDKIETIVTINVKN